MNRRHYLLTIVLSLSAGLAGHALYGVLVAPPPAEARAAATRDSPWEYCAIVRSQAAPTARIFYWITYFRGEGVRTETVEAALGGNSYAKAIAKLGEEGWEMVGEGPLDVRPDPRPGPPSGALNALFFKRRKD